MPMNFETWCNEGPTVQTRFRHWGRWCLSPEWSLPSCFGQVYLQQYCSILRCLIMSDSEGIVSMHSYELLSNSFGTTRVAKITAHSPGHYLQSLDYQCAQLVFFWVLKWFQYNFAGICHCGAPWQTQCSLVIYQIPHQGKNSGFCIDMQTSQIPVWGFQSTKTWLPFEKFAWRNETDKKNGCLLWFCWGEFSYCDL